MAAAAGAELVALGVLGLVAGAISAWRRRGTAGGDHGPWAYGPVGRTLANAIVVTHITAVALHCIPDKDSCWSFRGTAGALVKPWLDVTQTAQSWDMFAPNPMRTNDFLEVLVTDAAGETWDLRTDVNSPRNKQIPWIWYDRAGKITRRVIGEGKWYRSWLGATTPALGARPRRRDAAHRRARARVVRDLRRPTESRAWATAPPSCSPRGPSQLAAHRHLRDRRGRPADQRDPCTPRPAAGRRAHHPASSPAG
ncbi:MAG: hypothetical protein IPK74_11975 [Deltaproteobacteria bacterium]|nr:hypothetical protein [Deltaproteobacteria bacterium]